MEEFLMKKLTMITACFLATILSSSCAHTYKDLSDSSYLSFASEPAIRVKVSGSRRIKSKIIEIPIETYLAGVIGHEMSPRWPAEALKAQTVAARSYALYQMQQAHASGRRYDVVDTQADQVFKESGTHNAHLADIVNQTHGQVLWKKGRIVQAFYSSTCGGKSETAAGAGFSLRSPLKYSQNDKFCSASPFRSWSVYLTPREIAARMKRYGYNTKNLRSLRVKNKNPSGYAQTLEYKDDFGRHEINASTFRRLAGNMRVKSLLFDIHTDATGLFVVTGNGFGHGVGLCQYGAKEMALQATDYKKILKQYYKKIPIKKLYN